MAELSFCLVSTFYPPYSFGGDAVHVHRLATGLAQRGHRVRVITGEEAYHMLGDGSPSAEGFAHDPRVEVVSGLSSSIQAATTYLTGGPVGYRSRLAALMEGFDVVHFHNPSLVGGAGGLSLGEAIKLYTTHEHWLLCPTHVLFRYRREICRKRTCWRCTLYHRRPPQLWRSTDLLDRSVASLDVVLAPSRFTAGLHRETFPEARIEVVPLPGPNSAMLDDLPQPPSGIPEAFFLYAGRLEPIKGVGRLPAVAEAIGDAHLVVAGAGSLAPALEEASRRLPNLHYVGAQSYPTVLALCRASLAVVVPSAGYETFGGVAVEAMSVGTPVAVRDIGPLPELVEKGGGWTFGDDEELAGLLAEIWADPVRAGSEGLRAGEVYRSRWTEDLFFKRYMELVAESAVRRGRGELAQRAAAEAG